MIALAVGTLALRLVGPALRSRVALSPRVEHLSSMSVAVISTSALVVDRGFAGFALPAGVAVAAILAWRRAPFVAVVVAAAATTSVLRYVGVA